MSRERFYTVILQGPNGPMIEHYFNRLAPARRWAKRNGKLCDWRIFRGRPSDGLLVDSSIYMPDEVFSEKKHAQF